MSECLSDLLQDYARVFVGGTVHVEGASSHLHVAAGRPTALFNFVSHYLIYFLSRGSLGRGDNADNFFGCVCLLNNAAVDNLRVSLRFLRHHWLYFLLWLRLLLFGWKIGCILFFLFVVGDIDRSLWSLFRRDRLNWNSLRCLENLRFDRYCRGMTPEWLGTVVSGNVVCFLFDLRCVVLKLRLRLLHLRQLKITDRLVKSGIQSWLSRCIFGRFFFETLEFDSLVE